jgi:hypothetical protein
MRRTRSLSVAGARWLKPLSGVNDNDTEDGQTGEGCLRFVIEEEPRSRGGKLFDVRARTRAKVEARMREKLDKAVLAGVVWPFRRHRPVAKRRGANRVQA